MTVRLYATSARLTMEARMPRWWKVTLMLALVRWISRRARLAVLRLAVTTPIAMFTVLSFKQRLKEGQPLVNGHDIVEQISSLNPSNVYECKTEDIG